MLRDAFSAADSTFVRNGLRRILPYSIFKEHGQNKLSLHIGAELHKRR